MSDEKIFVDGLIVKKPHENAPDFVKAKVSMKMADLIAFAKQHHNDGWLNAEIKESKGGKFYAELDSWKPDPSKQSAPSAPAGEFEDDIPF